TVAHGTYLRNNDIFEVVNHQGVYRSAGIGGGIYGMGFSLGGLDDPVKSHAEAMSPTLPDKLWEWYWSGFYNPPSANAPILLTMTRWHEDDLAGRLLKEMAENPKADKWTVLRFPAIAEPEGERMPEDTRQTGEALWPERFGLSFLEKLQSRPYEFSGIYQQR